MTEYARSKYGKTHRPALSPEKRQVDLPHLYKVPKNRIEKKAFYDLDRLQMKKEIA